jgi:transcriptional regulator with XRE-family HTH domain
MAACRLQADVESAVAFGLLVKARREALGVSQAQFADECLLHRTEISLIERGCRDVRLETVCSLARALEISASELLGGLDIDALEPRVRPTKGRRRRDTLRRRAGQSEP